MDCLPNKLTCYSIVRTRTGLDTPVAARLQWTRVARLHRAWLKHRSNSRAHRDCTKHGSNKDQTLAHTGKTQMHKRLAHGHGMVILAWARYFDCDICRCLSTNKYTLETMHLVYLYFSFIHCFLLQVNSPLFMRPWQCLFSLPRATIIYSLYPGINFRFIVGHRNQEKIIKVGTKKIRRRER